MQKLFSGKLAWIAGALIAGAAAVVVFLQLTGRLPEIGTRQEVASASAPNGSKAGAKPTGQGNGAGNRPAGGPGGQGGGRGGPIQVIAQPAEEREFVVRLEAIGTLEPRERVELAANASDRVTGVYFEDGQRVKKGATLLTLASEEERAQLEAAQAQLAEARRQLDRNQRLSQDGAVSQLEVQRSTRDEEAASAQVRALEVRVRDRVLVAPFEGVLGFRKVSLGAYVSPGETVATLIDDSEMRLEFAVPSIHGSSLQKGLTIEGRTADVPGRLFTGKLTSIDNAIDPATRSIRVRATLPNEDRALKAGMFVTVELMADQHRSISVPEISVVAEGAETFVYTVNAEEKPPVAVKVPIIIGVRERGLVEVKDGLKAGDLVVVEGVLKLRPNAPVVIQQQPSAGRSPSEPVMASGAADKPGLVR